MTARRVRAATAAAIGSVQAPPVGYGDVAPITPEGKVAASILMLLGIGLFSAITATVTSFMLMTGQSTPALGIGSVTWPICARMGC